MKWHQRWTWDLMGCTKGVTDEATVPESSQDLKWGCV